MEPINVIEYKGYEINIYQDELCDNSPRDWDNLGTMVWFHKRYYSPDEEKSKFRLGKRIPFLSPSDFMTFLEEENPIYLPIYMYDHSGITINTTGFCCPWDSGQVGWIYVEREKVKGEFSWKQLTKQRIKKIEDYLRQEVKTYDQYLTGDVHGYIIKRGDEEFDSCWGFYGDNWLENGLEDQAKDIINSYVEEQKKKDNITENVTSV